MKKIISKFKNASAYALATSMTFSAANDAKAFVDPITIAAGANLIGALISAGGSGASVSMEMNKAQIEMLKGLNLRFDGFEAGLSELLFMNANQPEVARKIREEGADLTRIEESLAMSNTLQQELNDCRRAPENAGYDEECALAVRALLVDHRTARERLFKRTDFAVVPIAFAYMIEAEALKKSKQGWKLASDNGHGVNDIYKARFEQMLDASDGLSLAYKFKALKEYQNALETDIAQAVGMETVRSGAIGESYGVVISRWKETRYEPPRQVSGPDDYDTSRKPYEVDMESLTCHKYTRSLNLTSLNTEMGLFKLEYKIGAAEVLADNPCAEIKSYENADAMNEAINQQTKIIQGKIDQFNRQADALEKMSSLMGFVSLIVKHLESPDANMMPEFNISARSADMRDNVEFENDLGFVAQKDRVTAIVDGMSIQRINSWEKFDKSMQAIQDAVDEGQRNAWRADLVAGLQIVSAMATFMHHVDIELTASRMQEMANLTNAIRGMPEGVVNPLPENVLEGAPPEPARQQSNLDSDFVNPGAHLPGYDDYLLNVDIKEVGGEVRYAMHALHYLKSGAGFNSGDMEQDFKNKQALYRRGMGAVMGLEDTAADKFADRNKTLEQILEIWTEDLSVKGMKGAMQGLFMEVLKPTNIGDSTLQGRGSRMTILKNYNTDYTQFVLKHLPETSVTKKLERSLNFSGERKIPPASETQEPQIQMFKP